MTNSAFPRDRAEAQRSDSFRMQSEVALKKKKKRTFLKTSQSSPPLRRISLERMLLHNCKGMQTGRDAHREGGTKIPTDLSAV